MGRAEAPLFDMSTPSPDQPGMGNWLLIIGLGIIWGSAFMAIALSLDGYSPLWTAALRVAFGAVAVLLWAEATGQSVRHLYQVPKAWAFAGAIGMMTATIPMVLLTWGLQFVPSAFAGIAMGTVPLLILPLAYLFSPEEGIGPRRIIGIALGFFGLVLLVGTGAFEGGTLSAQLACILAASCYAIGSITTRRAPKMPPLAFAGATLLVGAGLLIPLAAFVEGPPQLAPIQPTLALIYLGLLPTGLAAVMRVRVITTAGSVFMSQTSYMVPLWATFFGVVLLGESLPAQTFLSLALILAGIAISQSRKR